MTRSIRLALALLGSAAALTACDYRWSPGENPQFRAGFEGTPPPYRNQDVNRDSINYKQRTETPVGVGSATAIANGTVEEQMESAPAGNSAAPQTASGQMGTVDQTKAHNGSADKATDTGGM